MKHYTNLSNKDYVDKVQMIRRSNASGIHQSTKSKSQMKKKSIEMHLKSFGM